MIVGQVKDYFLGWNPKKTIQYKRKQLVSSKNLLAANLKELINPNQAKLFWPLRNRGGRNQDAVVLQAYHAHLSARTLIFYLQTVFRRIIMLTNLIAI